MNAAQTLLTKIGAPCVSLPKQAHGNKNASATKAGSGRHHVEGHSKDTPRTSAGAPRGFALHTASSEKKERRALVKVHGRRQAIKALKHWRHEHKNANEHY